MKHDGAQHEREHGQKLASQKDRTSRLPYQKLTNGAETVLTGDLGRRNPKGHYAEKHGGSVDTVYQSVGLGQLGEAGVV